VVYESGVDPQLHLRRALVAAQLPQSVPFGGRFHRPTLGLQRAIDPTNDPTGQIWVDGAIRLDS
jgi:hypothetical protein